MTDQDLPFLDDTITQLPKDIREDLAEKGRNDLFFFSKGILGYRDMTESCHAPLTVFVDHNPARFKLMMMPRDHYKSSVITIAGGMQKVARNQEERILIGNESATNAQRFLRSIRQHAEGNRVFRSLYSSIIPKDTRKVRWNDEELQFNREGFYPEPTFDTIGMTGSVTSRHYTHITIDDPISEEAVKSEKVMADVITRLSAVTALLVKPETDTYWLVGTRWAIFDIYSWHMKTYGPLMAKFIRGAIEDGLPIFPELLSLDMLAVKRKALGEYRFSCLYMNNPRNSELQDLNVDDLKFFQWRDDGKRITLFDKTGEPEETVYLEDLDITTTVDPAPAEKITSDRNAVVTVGITPRGKAIVLEAWGARCTPLELIEKLFEIKERFHPRLFAIEGVAYQKSLKYFIKDSMERRGLYLRIEELPQSNSSKAIRIRGLQPIMATGRLYIDPIAHYLRNEMADFPLGEHDDVLDALSMQMQVWRGIMSPERWAKYQESEKKLLHSIKTNQLSTIPNRRKDFDDDTEEEDPNIINAPQQSVIIQ